VIISGFQPANRRILPCIRSLMLPPFSSLLPGIFPLGRSFYPLFSPFFLSFVFFFREFDNSLPPKKKSGQFHPSGPLSMVSVPSCFPGSSGALFPSSLSFIPFFTPFPSGPFHQGCPPLPGRCLPFSLFLFQYVFFFSF